MEICVFPCHIDLVHTSLILPPEYQSDLLVYWPLAFLLRPLPTDDRIERKKLDLCWPWTNPAQLFLIIGSGIFGIAAVFISSIGTESLLGFTGWSVVPFWLEYLFILDWSRLEPWHWANLMIAVTGAAMLYLAGNAVAA